jgi:osmoprotectant transport system substrate-binding protein
MRKFALLAVCATLAAACTPASAGRSPSGPGGSRELIVIGVSGAFTENQLVAEMYAQVLARAGYHVERQFNLPSRESSQSALESGQIDLKPEYLSSLLLYLDRNAQPSNDASAVARQDSELLRSRGITVLTPSPADDTNDFVVNAQTAQRFHLTTMSSLAPVAGQLVFGGPPECPERPLCLIGLHRIYGLLFKDFVALDAGGPETIAALKENKIQVGLLFSTDPSIEENGFVPLVDDKHLQNAENITPVMRTDKLNPDIRGLLDAVSAKLTTENVTELIRQVLIDHKTVRTVAGEFLATNGFL